MRTADPPGAASPLGETARGAGRVPLLAALGYTAFVVYGSLVPLSFRPRPLTEAIEAFRHIAWLDLGIASRADWVANILLFVPLAYLWMAVFEGRSVRARAAASAGVLVAGASLSLAIEFVQLFFPPRTVSLNDLLAEVLGALTGIALWWFTGPAVTRWAKGWARTRSAPGVYERLLAVYLFVLFAYSLLPLDLTLSPVELFRKWRGGRVVLLPFTAWPEGAAQWAYNLASDVAVWVPAAFLWRMSGRATDRQVLRWVFATACVLEAMQLFVFSRVTDLTDVVLALLGAWLGLRLARLAGGAGRGAAVPEGGRGGRGAAGWLWALAVAGWCAVLGAVFWYPFDFNTEWGFVHGRLAGISRVPFRAYYYGSEFRAITEVLHKTGFFAPLGMLFGLGAIAAARRLRIPRAALHLLATGLLAVVAAAIEVVQVFLPGKNADPTDWVLEVLGGVAGYACAWWLARVRTVGADAVPGSAQRDR